MAVHGLLTLLCVVLGIIVYLSFRFEWKYAIARTRANWHDVNIILGFFTFFQWEFSLSALAAMLAALSYSVNESAVISDQIRKTFRKTCKLTVIEVINHAITRTMQFGLTN
ncbi:preprotein translocase subunit SecF [Mycoavidus cysteinexigens]|uniref:Preprotein translocase subunit SecF n=1 Tax=Mycoavidus cysteinexigens TaxID=1553431 RepID=A0A2Z6EXK4_9BURK|nr:preprotein translocase subunit SecF [Mycoavidus cysteinexigens]GAM53457.1 protein-export membrane protein SecF [bacterium endosymbiont of Mortierella elongata FMR23-6]GLR00601.1 hypothetical protein GCM10007934_04120 [Mycoavidus cysteinexigens]